MPFAAARHTPQSSTKDGQNDGNFLCAAMRAALCLVIASGLTVTGLAQSHWPGTVGLRTMTTVNEAHTLSSKAAAQNFPVHLHAVVTNCYPQPGVKALAMYIHDETDSIFVWAPNGAVPVPAPGDVVDLHGQTDPGLFAPIIGEAFITVIGHAGLPPNPPNMTLARLRTGAEDAQWVQVEGVVRSVTEGPESREISLQLAMDDGMITATTQKVAGADYSSLVDAKVSIHGNASPLYNGNRQVIGSRLQFPDLSVVHVVETVPHDPFDRPVLAIDGLSKYEHIAESSHRIHIRGRVTLQWLGLSLCLTDATHGICAESGQRTPVALGDMVDVVGFAANGASGPVLTDAIFRKRTDAGGQSDGPKASVAEQLTAEQVITSGPDAQGVHDANLVQIEGRLIGRDLAAADTTLMLESGKVIFAAILPKDLAVPELSNWQNGSVLRVTGVCSVQIDAQITARNGGAAVSKSFRVLLRSPADVAVLETPSWWTPQHTAMVLSAAMVMMLGVMAWVVALRRRVDSQTKVIRESEERFRELAQHDGLTGTASRLLLHERLESVLEQAKITGAYLGILMLDLDRFKLINDTLGHDAGDRALRVTAERIREVVRKADLVSRVGGDEFVVLLPDLGGPVDALRVAAKLVEALSHPIQIGDTAVPISTSVGVCVSKGGELDSSGLLKSVDAALYRAKAQGRNCYELFTPEMARATVEKVSLLAGLTHALERDELELHYQPMVSFETGRLMGFEALLRWRSQTMGLMAPDKFIPIAEESGLIVPIGEWVVREACREIGLLEKELGQTFMLGVNLSPLQFQQEGLARMIERTLAEHDRSPRAIEFEVTESMLMSDSTTTTGALARLRAQGIRISIDDFGIGFSSFSYIMRFAIDRIKIDKSFIKDLVSDKNTLAVVRAIIAMAHGLGIEVVAEGVETEEQFSLLVRERCDTAQGYFLSRPVPASQLPAVIKMLKEIPILESQAAANARKSGLRVA